MNLRDKAMAQMTQILSMKYGNSALKRDYDNLASTKKSLMRLCAFAVVDGGTIGKAQKLVIANIIVRRYLNRSLDELAQIYRMLSGIDLPHSNDRYVNDDEIEGSLNPILKEYVQSVEEKDEDCYHSSLQKLYIAINIVEEIVRQLTDSTHPNYAETRKSILMNIDSLSKRRIYIELCDLMLVVKADKSLMDCEREAFRVFCKVTRIVRSTLLWQELSECNERVLWRLPGRTCMHLVQQKRSVDINDCRSIEASISFYNIKGPFVDSIYYSLQRIQALHQDVSFYRNRKWTQRAFVIFVLTSIIIFLKVSYPQLEPSNVLSAIQETCEVPAWISGLPDIGGSCSDKNASVIPIVALMFVVLMVSVWCIIMALPRRLKNGFIHWIRCLRGRNVVLWLLFLVFSVIITIMFFLFTLVLLLLFQPLCVLGLTISIEWMSFMQEYLHERTQPQKSYTLIWIVVASIVVDVSMSIAEHYNHYYTMSPNYVDVIASALFSGCLSFIFGKWLENHKMMAQQTQNEMRRIVQMIGRRVEV